MNFHATQIDDTAEFDFSATYGTAVFLLRSEKPAAEVFGMQDSPRIGHLPEHGDALVRHPKAA